MGELFALVTEGLIAEAVIPAAIRGASWGLGIGAVLGVLNIAGTNPGELAAGALQVGMNAAAQVGVWTAGARDQVGEWTSGAREQIGDIMAEAQGNANGMVTNTVPGSVDA